MSAFLREVADCLRRLPDKLAFGGMLLAWVALFHFWGNITLGYVKTESLFGWMNFIYAASPDDEYGRWIPLVVLGLCWWKRRELLNAVRGSWWPAIVLVLLGLGLHLLGYRVQQTRLSIVGFFLGLYGFCGMLWGAEFLRRSFYPMWLFIFCVPLGTESDRITSPLRILATYITTGLANTVLGLDVWRDGARIFDPTGRYQYEVAAACSGIRSLTAITLCAVVYAMATFRTGWRRGVVMLSAVPLAVAGNVFRLLSIIVGAELFGQEGGNYVHDSAWLSLLPYVPAILGLLALGWLLREPDMVKENDT